MHALFFSAAFFVVALFLYWIVRAADAFSLLCWADETQPARLAAYCGVNPHFLPERVMPAAPVALYRVRS